MIMMTKKKITGKIKRIMLTVSGPIKRKGDSVIQRKRDSVIQTQSHKVAETSSPPVSSFKHPWTR